MNDSKSTSTAYKLEPKKEHDQAGPWQRLRHVLYENLNFFRIHLLAFTLIPLIISCIMYAANGEDKIDYIDILLLCVSCFTNTGLSPIDISRTTAFQQALLEVQMLSGSIIVVSWIMAYVRMRIFKTTCQHIVEQHRSRIGLRQRLRRGTVDLVRSLSLGRAPPSSERHPPQVDVEARSRRQRTGSIRPYKKPLITRVDTILKPIDPSGQLSRAVEPVVPTQLTESPAQVPILLSPITSRSSAGYQANPAADHPEVTPGDHLEARLHTNPNLLTSPFTTSPGILGFPLPLDGMLQPTTYASANASSVAFRQTETLRHRKPKAVPLTKTTFSERPHNRRRDAMNDHRYPEVDLRFSARNPNVGIGFGGFPGPFQLFQRGFAWAFPRTKQRIARTLTMNLDRHTVHGKDVPYIDFDALVGRNSEFINLTEEQLEVLGGAEYVALKFLLKVVAGYYIGLHLIGWAFVVPHFVAPKWATLFNSQSRPVSPSWASVFLVTAAITNSGLSLIDTSMVPFQQEYVVMVVTALLILAGDTGFPISLRGLIWGLSKILPKSSNSYKGAHFLLDHPRRCYMYLFPSLQTWFLVFVTLLLSSINWLGFLILDIGIPTVEAIPLGTRIVVGFLQTIAVRCAGFAAISVTSLAPAVLVMFFVFMYIAPYPIAMTVRSTNVYEDRAIGVFDSDSDSSDDESLSKKEKEFEEQVRRVPKHQRQRVWGKYLAFHARRQLAFDIWWLVFALFLITVIDRHAIIDPNQPLFNIFTIMFELVSAYGSIGLSIGLPNANYSACGAFHPLSKVIVCLVMIRGRQRGLPVAIDRAVMLPREFQRELSKGFKGFEMAEGGQNPANLDAIPEGHPMEKNSVRESLHQPEGMDQAIDSRAFVEQQ